MADINTWMCCEETTSGCQRWVEVSLEVDWRSSRDSAPESRVRGDDYTHFIERRIIDVRTDRHRHVYQVWLSQTMERLWTNRSEMRRQKTAIQPLHCRSTTHHWKVDEVHIHVVAKWATAATTLRVKGHGWAVLLTTISPTGGARVWRHSAGRRCGSTRISSHCRGDNYQLHDSQGRQLHIALVTPMMDRQWLDIWLSHFHPPTCIYLHYCYLPPHSHHRVRTYPLISLSPPSPTYLHHHLHTVIVQKEAKFCFWRDDKSVFDQISKQESAPAIPFNLIASLGNSNGLKKCYNSRSWLRESPRQLIYTALTLDSTAHERWHQLLRYT